MTTQCLHCDQPVPHNRQNLTAPQKHYCCSGCEAAAAFTASDHYAEFDQPDILREYAQDAGNGILQADVLAEGIRCGACAAAIEQKLRGLDGLLKYSVNAHNRIISLQWQAGRASFSQLLKIIAELGYEPSPLPLDAGLADIRKEDRRAFLRLGIAGLGAMQVMMLSMGLYFSDALDVSADMRFMMTWASMLLATPVVIYSGQPFFSGAWNNLRHQRVGMDVPVALAIAAAYGMSVIHSLQGQGEIWFDSACMFVFFLSLGRHFEARGRRRAQQGLRALVASQPQTATVIGDRGPQSLPLRALQTGMRLLVRPGETFPADGRITKGNSQVDESLLTGESRPQARSEGDSVLAGSINCDQALEMTAEKIGANTTRANLMRLLRRAEGAKPRATQLADQVAGWFVLAVLAIAAITGLVWNQLDPERAFSITLAVLVVTCPCALSLATPASLSAATAALAKRGFLVTRPHTLEALTRITHVVFDKTGTLTHERLEIAQVRAVKKGWLPEDVLIAAAALERDQNHPIADALRSNDQSCACLKTEYRPGYGVTAEYQGHRYALGAPARLLLDANNASNASGIPEDGNSWIVLTEDDIPVGWIGLRAALRDDAEQAIKQLQAAGLSIELMSGDHPAPVAAVAKQLGIQQARGSMLPEDKLAAVQALREQGATVMMVGDGLNDAPVLAGADVSVAMQAGAALAQASADSVLLSGQLTALQEARQLAQRARRILFQNLGWALGYNALAVPLAVMGLLTPWMAAIGMSLSSLFVVTNALRLLKNPTQERATRLGQKTEVPMHPNSGLQA